MTIICHLINRDLTQLHDNYLFNGRTASSKRVLATGHSRNDCQVFKVEFYWTRGLLTIRCLCPAACPSRHRTRHLRAAVAQLLCPRQACICVHQLHWFPAEWPGRWL